MFKKNKILFVVPDGVGIRNYLYSNILSYLKADNITVVIWSPLPRSVFDEVERLHNITIEYRFLKLLPEPPLTRLFREATTFARLLHNTKLKKNTSILNNWNKPKGISKRSWMLRCAQMLGSYIARDYKCILKYEARSRKNWSASAIHYYQNDLHELQPSNIFITHQRVASLMPICLAAKNLGLPVTTAIFSWDNLPKARLCVVADTYLVWGDWMYQEMKDYYPEISSEKVKLVGTPQFEFYLKDSKLLSRDRFAEHHGLDIRKKWICFSGDDVKTSPYDAMYLEDLSAALEPYQNKIQIIFRRCPVDFSDRYDMVLEKYNDLIFSVDPLWQVSKESGWTGYYAKYEDLEMQINLAKHCELVINLGSTMALDFIMFNKPCLYLNYNPVENINWNVEKIYNYQHFRSMKELDAVGWIDSKKSIAHKVLKTVNNPDQVAKEKKLWMERIVHHPVSQASHLISKILQ